MSRINRRDWLLAAGSLPLSMLTLRDALGFDDDSMGRLLHDWINIPIDLPDDIADMALQQHQDWITNIQAAQQLTMLLIPQREVGPLLDILQMCVDAGIGSAESLLALVDRIETVGFPASTSPYAHDALFATHLIREVYPKAVNAWLKRSRVAQNLVPLPIFLDPRFSELLQLSGVQPGATVGQLFLALAACPGWIIVIILAAVILLLILAIRAIQALFGWNACRIAAAMIRETVDNSGLPTENYQQAVDETFHDRKPSAGEKADTAKCVEDEIKGEKGEGRKKRLQALAGAIRKSEEPK